MMRNGQNLEKIVIFHKDVGWNGYCFWPL